MSVEVRSQGVVMVDVARAAGVSQKTVSRVVNEAPYVRAEVRDRVLAAIDELGYSPNVAARSLVNQRRRTYVIGVIAVGLSTLRSCEPCLQPRAGRPATRLRARAGLAS